MLAHQLHAELMGYVLGVRARRQGEAAPPVWGELLLLQLGVQATGECHLEDHTVVQSYDDLMILDLSKNLKHLNEIIQ